MDEVIGRKVELSVIDRLLDDLSEGAAGLTLTGEPGIGKTALWLSAVTMAEKRGYRVLTSRPSQSEDRLGFAGLGDLLGNLVADEYAQALPGAQRRALDAALWRGPAPRAPQDRLGVHLAVQSLLRGISRETPLVVAVDDVQWLDPSSTAALTFVLRRLCSHRIGFIVSARTGFVPPFRWADGVEIQVHQLDLGPLSVGAIHRLLEARLSVSLARPVLLRVHDATGGNPLFALELTRALLKEPDALQPSSPLPVPESLQELVQRHLRGVSAGTERLLQVMAVMARPPTLDLLRRTWRGRRSFERDFDAALDAGIIQVHDESVRFAHPLLASAVSFGMRQSARRRLHTELAHIVDDPEERARHAAQAALGADADIASQLERAATAARARGAPEAGAELLEHAIWLTPAGEHEQRHARQVLAAEHYFHAGDWGKARTLLEHLVAVVPAGSTRAGALELLGEVCFHGHSLPAAAEMYRQALDEASDDPARKARISLRLAFCLISLQRHGKAEPYGQAALSYASREGDCSIRASALVVNVMVDFLLGRDLDEPRLEDALQLEADSPGLSMEMRPSLIAALLMLWTDRTERALGLLHELRRRVMENGEASSLPMLLHHLTTVEVVRGNLASACGAAEECLEMATQVGGAHVMSLAWAAIASVRACTGDYEDAMRAADRSLAFCEESGWIVNAVWARHAIGVLALSLGDPEGAYRALKPVVPAAEKWGYVDPGSMRFLPDAIEALVGLGQLERADRLTSDLEERSMAFGRRAPLAAARRCRALLRASHGDLSGALEAVGSSTETFRHISMPVDVGRNLIVQAQVQRRLRRWRKAKDAAEEALGIFNDRGFVLWADRARSELSRSGERTKTPSGLTPTQAQIAHLVAQGLTNREIASHLIVSPKTVEANLANIYRKLGITRRAQLGLAIDSETGR